MLIIRMAITKKKQKIIIFLLITLYVKDSKYIYMRNKENIARIQEVSKQPAKHTERASTVLSKNKSCICVYFESFQTPVYLYIILFYTIGT
jgi:hypothetical protein